MRASAVVPFAFLLLLLLAGLAPLASAKDVPVPRWQVGDEWTYAVTVTQGGAPVQTGERHVVVVERGPFTYQGATREAVTIAVFLNMTGDPSASYEDIRDAATGELLATRSGGQTMMAVQPCTEIDYPVTYPKSWTDTCDLGFGPSETFYTVAGGETLTVPAGTFDTLSVDAIGMDAVRYWLSADACGKVAEFSQVNDQATYVNLTRTNCAPSSPTVATPPGTATAPPPTGATAPTAATSPTRATPATTPGGTPPTGGANATLALPRFTAQDNWHYESTGTLGGATYRVNTTAKVTSTGSSIRFEGNVNVTDASGTSVLAYMVSSNVDATTGAVLSEDVSPYIGVDLFRTSRIATDERRYDAPCQFVRWPITPGQEWSFSCTGKLVNMTPGGKDATFRVEGTGRAEAVRQVTTPAGSFTGFPVRLTYTYSDGLSRTETRVYAAEPCAYVQMVPGPWGGTDELRGFYCESTKQGELVPEPLPDRPSPSLGALALLAAAVGVALALRKRRG